MSRVTPLFFLYISQFLCMYIGYICIYCTCTTLFISFPLFLQATGHRCHWCRHHRRCTAHRRRSRPLRSGSSDGTWPRLRIRSAPSPTSSPPTYVPRWLSLAPTSPVGPRCTVLPCWLVYCDGGQFSTPLVTWLSLWLP